MTEVTKIRIAVTGVALLVVLALLPSLASAQGVTVFTGFVTIDGSPAPPATVVEISRSDGTVLRIGISGTAGLANNQYRIDIQSTTDLEGQTVSYSVVGKIVSPPVTAVFRANRVIRKDISAVSTVTPTATPTPTVTPTPTATPTPTPTPTPSPTPVPPTPTPYGDPDADSNAHPNLEPAPCAADADPHGGAHAHDGTGAHPNASPHGDADTPAHVYAAKLRRRGMHRQRPADRHHRRRLAAARPPLSWPGAVPGQAQAQAQGAVEGWMKAIRVHQQGSPEA